LTHGRALSLNRSAKGSSAVGTMIRPHKHRSRRRAQCPLCLIFAMKKRRKCWKRGTGQDTGLASQPAAHKWTFLLSNRWCLRSFHCRLRFVDSMRGNRCVRAGDPLKSRRQRKRDKAEKIRKSRRGQSFAKKKLEVAARNAKRQTNSHVAALMESFVLRRKAVRKALQPKKSNAASQRSSSTEAAAPPAKTAPVSRALY
jgi:hypothetical protein